MEEGKTERTILLVEDNENQAHLIAEALKESSVPHQMVLVKDGIAALAYLRHEGEYTQTARPDIILLNLNLPKKNGKEVLAEIKADPKLKRIPVLVLTNSKSKEDILKSYELHVNCYITKSDDLSQLSEAVRKIEEFWLGIVTLPRE
ncbi:MAG: response regulator [Symploca sp. SIO3C6]|uniref:Response regulator n=1 Tax=Symploca sp. SIO1C4 TaxID=2607765 RepID=A0A6B3NFX7_9CYAN|nr:response regulator [Symploca sp. SIO3C6]NER29795.1 response regulator [Symploca sp. SIO1C4]